MTKEQEEKITEMVIEITHTCVWGFDTEIEDNEIREMVHTDLVPLIESFKTKEEQ